MKIHSVEDLHCGAGWRYFSFLRITTDNGLIGNLTRNPIMVKIST